MLYEKRNEYFLFNSKFYLLGYTWSGHRACLRIQYWIIHWIRIFWLDVAHIASQDTGRAVGLGFGLILGVLLGIQNKSLTNLASFFTTSFFSAIICAFISLAVGIGVVYFQTTGAFTAWQLLDSPVKFQQIVEADTDMVRAQATDGKLYSWNLYCYSDPKCNKWIEIIAVPENTHNALSSTIRGDSCQFNRNYKPKKQPAISYSTLRTGGLRLFRRVPVQQQPFYSNIFHGTS